MDELRQLRIRKAAQRKAEIDRVGARYAPDTTEAEDEQPDTTTNANVIPIR